MILIVLEEEVCLRLFEEVRDEDIILWLCFNIYIDVGDDIVVFDEDDWRELVVILVLGDR